LKRGLSGCGHPRGKIAVAVKTPYGVDSDFTLSKGRLESFSDGVFAIAITLLVLTVHLPDSKAPSSAQQLHDLLSIWPEYAVYFVAFATIGIMWINHHALLKNLQRVTHGVLLANLLLLAFISFLPFPTEVLAQYGITNVAIVYYGVVMSLISVAYTLLYMQVYAAHVREKTPLRVWSLAGLTFYPIASVIGYFLPMGGLLVMALLAFFYMHPRNIRAVVLPGG
jgi:uncharacterized membrane protein